MERLHLERYLVSKILLSYSLYLTFWRALRRYRIQRAVKYKSQGQRSGSGGLSMLFGSFRLVSHERQGINGPSANGFLSMALSRQFQPSTG